MVKEGPMGRLMNRTPVSEALLMAILVALLALAGSPLLHAQTYTVLHRFTGSNGSSPYGALTLDSKGNLYGMTRDGGANGSGTIFELSGTKEKVLYSFRDNPDGANPLRSLLRDSAGNLYGTTPLGGSSGSGAVFKLDTTGSETVLYNFSGGTDGDQPQTGLVRDTAGNLYGTTVLGGGSNLGTVFKVDSTGIQTILHSFGGAADGEFPYASLIRDGAGNFYGTTGGDGATSWGTVFKVDGSGKETVLYSFKGGADGGQPLSGLLRDAAGNLYGTTYSGGNGNGTVFKVDKSGNETVLYAFAGGGDGANPLGGLVKDNSGNFYGTTENGGAFSFGTIFKVAANGQETVLHSFGDIGKDGKYPEAGLVRGSTGTLYGATYLGGTGSGVVFRLRP
jgi:uncharacterized repeat protein (TIGR03803 family)